MGVYIFMTQYLQLVLGLTPLQAGIATVPWSLCFTVGSLLAPRLARHWGARRVMVRGLLLAAVGFGITALVVPPYGLWILIAGMLAMSLGMAPVFTVGNELIITTAPAERAGAASALAETSAELSGALGIAVLGSLGMLAYRLWLDPALPASLADADTTRALSTLGGAVAVGGELGGAAGMAVVDTARTAFTGAMRAIAVFGMAMMLLAAWMAARLMRDGEGEAHVAVVAEDAAGA
jgi:DHA2 family multidrug resistance protein-like MFS transporter